MKRILEKDIVAKTLATLTAEKGKKPTLAVLHAALGNRGSTSTLVAMLKEIEADLRPATEAGEAFKTFLEIWELAMDEGRNQSEAKIKELTDIQNTLCQDNIRLEGAATAAQERAATLEKENAGLQSELVQTKAELEKRLNEAQAALVDANGRVSQAFEKLAQTQSAHASEVTTLRAERDKAIEKQRTTELELAVCKARLEAK